MVSKTIGLTDEQFIILASAKTGFEKLTGGKLSWGAYLVALASGALAGYTISGFELRCPDCGNEMGMRLVRPKVKPSEASLVDAPFFSREQPLR